MVMNCLQNKLLLLRLLIVRLLSLLWGVTVGEGVVAMVTSFWRRSCCYGNLLLEKELSLEMEGWGWIQQC